MEQPIKQSVNKTEYMREYMRARYQADHTKEKQYRSSCRVKAKNNIPNEEFSKYKHHLADIVKLKEILTRVPKEMVLEIFQNAPTCTTPAFEKCGNPE